MRTGQGWPIIGLDNLLCFCGIYPNVLHPGNPQGQAARAFAYLRIATTRGRSHPRAPPREALNVRAQVGGAQVSLELFQSLGGWGAHSTHFNTEKTQAPGS